MADHWPDILMAIAQVCALIPAGIFFIVKLFQGYHIVDLSVQATAERTRQEGGQDRLKIRVDLHKGSRATLVLHDVSASVSHDQQKPEDKPAVISFPGVKRMSYKPSKLGGKQIDWSKTAQSKPLLQLSPNENTRFEALTTVRADAECVIEVRVMGNRKGGKKFGQWCSTVVSLPVST